MKPNPVADVVVVVVGVVVVVAVVVSSCASTCDMYRRISPSGNQATVTRSGLHSNRFV